MKLDQHSSSQVLLIKEYQPSHGLKKQMFTETLIKEKTMVLDNLFQKKYDYIHIKD